MPAAEEEAILVEVLRFRRDAMLIRGGERASDTNKKRKQEKGVGPPVRRYLRCSCLGLCNTLTAHISM